MRLILVAVHPSPSPQAVPLANAFLKSYLGESSIDVQLCDLYVDDSPDSSLERLLALEPDAVGFSLYLWNRNFCCDLANALKQVRPAMMLFAGGPEATADPQGMMQQCRSYDFILPGDGEIPFATLCRSLESGNELIGIPGIIMRGGQTLTASPPIANLDLIPSPYLSGILDVTCYDGILWQLSRGCAFSCDFCFDSRDQHGVRRFSLERIEAELRHFADNAVSQVFVLDSTFNCDRDRARTILRMIRKIAPLIHFHFEVRSEFIDREMAQLFAKITCSLQIGLQSADPDVLKGVGRILRLDDFVKRIALLNESGAVFGFDMIYGLPGDTLTGFRKSLDFALRLYPNHLDIFPLAILPGTALAARADSCGLNHLSVPPYTVINSATMSAQDMKAAGNLASACDIFYTRGRAVAWFNGMLELLALDPSQFLDKFHIWVEGWKGSISGESEFDDEEIWRMQREFLTRLFSKERKHARFLPALLDLVDYHYHYAAALMTPLPQLTATAKNIRRDCLDIPAALHPGVRLARFFYEILEILETGASDARFITEKLEQCGSWGITYPAKEGVRTESVDECYYRLMERFDGKTPVRLLAGELGIPPEDARAFMKFVLKEGMAKQFPVVR